VPWVSGKRAEKKHSWEISLKCGVVLLRIDALGKKASCYLERIQLLDQRRLEGWLNQEDPRSSPKSPAQFLLPPARGLWHLSPTATHPGKLMILESCLPRAPSWNTIDPHGVFHGQPSSYVWCHSTIILYTQVWSPEHCYKPSQQRAQTSRPVIH
jgi:hypothetical protein